MALERELIARGHQVAREVAVPVFYKGHELGTQRLDMVVDERCVVEVKSTFDLSGAAKRQLQSYLHSTRLGVGLLLHFGPEAKHSRIVGPGARRGRHDSTYEGSHGSRQRTSEQTR